MGEEKNRQEKATLREKEKEKGRKIERENRGGKGEQCQCKSLTTKVRQQGVFPFFLFCGGASAREGRFRISLLSFFFRILLLVFSSRLRLLVRG